MCHQWLEFWRDAWADPEGLVGRKVALPEKKFFLHLKWCDLVNSEWYLCPCPHQKNVELPQVVVICWPLKMYSSVLCNFGQDLTYCHPT